MYKVKSFHDEIEYEGPIYNTAEWLNGTTFKNTERKNKGIPIIKIAELNRGIGSSTQFYSGDDKDKYLLKRGDFLYSWSGNPETSLDAHYFNLDEGILNQHIFKVSPKKFILKGYLYYLLNFLKPTLMRIAKDKQTTGLGHITIADLKELVIQVPKIHYQKSILSILDPISEKIKLNLKINETLKDFVKTLFKSWFIDFDPVRAKADGRSTGLSKEVSDLFSNSFEDSILGEMPRDWKIVNIESIFNFLEGPGIRNWQYTNNMDGIKFINIRCIKNGDLDTKTANKITKEEAYSKYKHFQLQEEDIVVSTSGTLGRFATVRKKHLPLNLNTSVIRFREKEGLSNISYLEGFISTQLQSELKLRATGSAQLNFGPTHLKEIKIILPNADLLNKFHDIIYPLIKRKMSTFDEIDDLIILKNTLLPKLISGELRIPDAEKLIDGVT